MLPTTEGTGRGLTVTATLLGALGSVFMKKGAAKFNMNIIMQLKNKSLLVGLVMFVLSAALYIPALRLSDLSILYPTTSMTYIWAVIFGKKFFNEKITRHKISGVLLIIAGISLITLF